MQGSGGFWVTYIHTTATARRATRKQQGSQKDLSHKGLFQNSFTTATASFALFASLAKAWAPSVTKLERHLTGPSSTHEQTLQEGVETSVVKAHWPPKFCVLGMMPEIIQLSGSHSQTKKTGHGLESMMKGGEVGLVPSKGSCLGESLKTGATIRPLSGMTRAS